MLTASRPVSNFAAWDAARAISRPWIENTTIGSVITHDAQRSTAGNHLTAAQAGLDQVVDMGVAGGVAEWFIAIAE